MGLQGSWDKADTLGTEVIKENPVFKEIHYSVQINKAKGDDNSLFPV